MMYKDGLAINDPYEFIDDLSQPGTMVFVEADGTFTYTPDPGATGVATFQYRVRDIDGNFSDFTTITIRTEDVFATRH